MFVFTFQRDTFVVLLCVVSKEVEMALRRGMILAFGLALLAGCGNQGNKSSSAPVEPKWKGPPYRIAFDTKAGKPGPMGINIPPVTFTANPDDLETRADLVMKFTAPGAAGQEPAEHLMIGTAVDIHGPEGKLPEDYMDLASASEIFTFPWMQWATR